MNNNKELKAILKLLHNYFPSNFRKWDEPSSALRVKMEYAKSDQRWLKMKECLATISDIRITDRSTYSTIRCFKMEMTLSDIKNKKYLAVMYISFLADYYAYKIRAIPLPSHTHEDFIKNVSSKMRDKMRWINSVENIGMNQDEKNRAIINILEGIPFFKEEIEKERLFYQNNPLFINEYPEGIENLFKRVLDCQKKAFNFQPFDKSYADLDLYGEAITRNSDRATLFDCLFTEELYNILMVEVNG